MKTENAVRILAGTIMLTSISLAHWVNPWWLSFGVVAGINLIQSARTGLCPAENTINRLGTGKGGGSCGR